MSKAKKIPLIYESKVKREFVKKERPPKKPVEEFFYKDSHPANNDPVHHEILSEIQMKEPYQWFFDCIDADIIRKAVNTLKQKYRIKSGGLYEYIPKQPEMDLVKELESYYIFIYFNDDVVDYNEPYTKEEYRKSFQMHGTKWLVIKLTNFTREEMTEVIEAYKKWFGLEEMDSLENFLTWFREYF